MEQIKILTQIPADYAKPSTARSLIVIAMDWAVIIGSSITAVYFQNIFVTISAQMIIASRQHAFFLLMHEATHFLLCKNNLWNDRISNLLTAWPLGFSTERYRTRHWQHHRFLNSEKDPDWTRKKVDPTWQFPATKVYFWKTSLPHLFGKGGIEMFYALRSFGLRKDDMTLFLPYAMIFAGLFTYFQIWEKVFLFWLVPYVTFMPFFQRIRNSSEHLALPKTNNLNGTRNIVSSPIESFFFSPHQGNLHLIHHLYPYIPFYRLKLVRKLLLNDSTYRIHAHENSTYFLGRESSVYDDFTNFTKQEKKRSAA